MQNPVIQRIKRRAEYRQSLPVTCGHRGNDTGNGLVTVVSLRSAVICFPENGKSPHSKPVTFLLPPTAKCRSGMFFTRCPPYVRHPDAGQRRHDRQCCQDAWTCQRQHDAALCKSARFVDYARYANCCSKHGVIAFCRTFKACRGHSASFPGIRPILRVGSENRSPCKLTMVYYGM